MNNDDQFPNCGLLEDYEEGGGYNSLTDAPPTGSEPTGQYPPTSSEHASNWAHLRNQSTGEESGETNVQKRKASVAESNSESDVTREIIHEWSGRANVSFRYTKKKADEVIKKANKKMQKSNCNHLKCTQCNKLFQSDNELRKHFVSKEHLVKVREKSESKTLGDLKKFAKERKNILTRVLGTLRGETHSNQHIPPAAAPAILATSSSGNDEQPYANSDGDGAIDSFLSILELEEENKKLKKENKALKKRLNQFEQEMSPGCLQNMVVELMKIKKEMGFNLETKSFYRLMDTVSEQYSSVLELMVSIMMSDGTITRLSGNYGERQKRGDEDKEEKAPKKRKKD